MLGRINGLWTAQNVTGDAIGAALLGGLGAVMTPAASASASGWALALVGVLLVGLLRELRRFQRPGNCQRKLSRVRLPGGGCALPGLRYWGTLAL
ncbi:enterobactin exporter EntS [Klebsiella pneumoniae]|nr:enterobactin exporter EntS [Klebsiella pneumoniae]